MSATALPTVAHHVRVQLGRRFTQCCAHSMHVLTSLMVPPSVCVQGRQLLVAVLQKLIFICAPLVLLHWNFDMGNLNVKAAVNKMMMMLLVMGLWMMVGAKIGASYFHDHVEALASRYQPDAAEEIRRLHSAMPRV